MHAILAFNHTQRWRPLAFRPPMQFYNRSRWGRSPIGSHSNQPNTINPDYISIQAVPHTHPNSSASTQRNPRKQSPPPSNTVYYVEPPSPPPASLVSQTLRHIIPNLPLAVRSVFERCRPLRGWRRMHLHARMCHHLCSIACMRTQHCNLAGLPPCHQRSC